MNFRNLVALLGLTALAACASNSESMGVKPGGAQDNGLVRGQIESGGIPAAEDISIAGILNEHDLPLEGTPCARELCINAAYAVAPTLDDEHGAVFVQLGFDTGIDPATFKRPALNLAVVVDRSGSMEEAGKLVSVKVALHKLVAQLTEADRLAIVLFNEQAEVLRPSALVTQPAAIDALIEGIRAGGSTDMAEGLRKGFAQIEPNAGRAGVSDRVMVFTDALTNTGDTETRTFIDLAAKNAEQNIGLSLFGVGLDLNQQLVLAITKLRGGNYFFLSDKESISAVFDQDFDYMVTPLAYDFAFTLTPRPGFRIREVYGYGGYSDGRPAVTIPVATLFLSRGHGAIVVRMETEGSPLPARRPIAELTLSYTPASGGERVSETVLHEWSSDEPIGSQTVFYSQPAVRKTVAVLNAGLALRRACAEYWEDRDAAEAKVILGKARAYLVSESQAFESSELAAEAKLVDQLDKNMGGEGSTSRDLETDLSLRRGCSAGGATQALPQAALLLLGLLTLRKGKKR
ncbi:MAG: VWA domain-containing protein [Deltaproteobacteria bacterium]|nr:VWA domain-containing protein [Deltaproteobacteria bacterium]